MALCVCVHAYADEQAHVKMKVHSEKILEWKSSAPVYSLAKPPDTKEKVGKPVVGPLAAGLEPEALPLDDVPLTAKLQGKFKKDDWNLVYKDLPIAVNKKNEFSLEIPLTAKITPVEVTAIGPYGEIIQEQLEIYYEKAVPGFFSKIGLGVHAGVGYLLGSSKQKVSKKIVTLKGGFSLPTVGIDLIYPKDRFRLLGFRKVLFSTKVLIEYQTIKLTADIPTGIDPTSVKAGKFPFASLIGFLNMHTTKFTFSLGGGAGFDYTDGSIGGWVVLGTNYDITKRFFIDVKIQSDILSPARFSQFPVFAQLGFRLK